MGWLAIVCAALAAILFKISGVSWLFWSSVIAGALAFWSYGIMHNYAVEAAKQRQDFRGDFYDITEQDADHAPNWATALNLLASLASLVLLLAAIYVTIVN